MKEAKLVLKYLVLFITMVILGIFLLIIVYLIPKKYIEKNIRESAEILYEEGGRVYTQTIFTQLFFKDKYTYGHNATDAIMINNVYSIDRNNILDSILKIRRNYVPGVTTDVKADENGNLLYNEKYEGLNPTAELMDTIEGKNIEAYEYARYWHGYIVILNILFVFFNFTQIKILMTIILLTSFLILTYLIYKKNPIYSILFFISFISMNILSWGAILQGMFVMIIAIVFSIFIALRKITISNLNISLFLIGILTAYVDFFTTPLITYLLPMVVFNIFCDEKLGLKKAFGVFVKTAIAWLLGYSMFWATKWILFDLIEGTNIVSISINQIIFRMNYSGNLDSIYLKSYALIINLLYSIDFANIAIVSLSIILFNNNLYKYGKEYLLNEKNIMYCVYRIFTNMLVYFCCVTFISTLSLYI